MASDDRLPTDETVIASKTDDGGYWDEPARPVLERGDTVGRYVVLERVGAGGMGMVYAAYDPELDRKVALKLVRPGRRGDPTVARTRLMREAQAMARLTHPNVITVHDVGEHAGQVFVAMEFIEGRTLTHWRKHEGRTWREIGAAFVKAAAGLAAAHAADVVHRDFKPDNVMIADDGRVVVMDFGLARAVLPEDHAESKSENPETPVPSGASSSGLSTSVTRDGALVGTPAYMAPEQHLGLPTDGRTDQFSFGVALYESLYDQHPFGGTSLAAIANAVTDGEVRPPPKGTEVPPWVRRVVIRALAVKAAERYPSMDALIEELDRDPGAARKRATLLIGVAGVAGIAAAIAYSTKPAAGAETCQGADEHVVRVWSPPVADQITTAFEGTGVAFASGSSARVRQQLDAYMAGWAVQHRAACEAGVRAENSDHVLDLRMACLQRDMDAARALLDVFGGADAQVVAKAADAVDGLNNPERCSDVDALLEGEHDPPEASVAEEVAAIQAALPEVRALLMAGKPKEAHALAVPLAERAGATKYGPVIAESLNILGHLQIDLGQYAEAEPTLERAVMTSIAHRTPVSAQAGARLAWVTGMALHRPKDGLRWADLVRAELKRNGRPNALVEVQLEKSAGEIHQRSGDLERALVHAQKAVELARRDFEGGHPATFGTLGALGAILIEQGKVSEGYEVLSEALQMREAALGPNHPTLGIILNNMGAAAEKKGDLEESLAHLRRAHDLKIATYGADHPSVGFSESNLSAALVRMKRYEEAAKRARRALEIWEPSFGPDHVTVCYALANLGRAELGLGNLDVARGHLDRALGLATKNEASRDVVGEIRFALARVHQDTDPKQALELAKAARADYESLGEDAPHELADVVAWLDRRN